MNRFIIPTKENKIAIWCRTYDEWIDVYGYLAPNSHHAHTRWENYRKDAEAGGLYLTAGFTGSDIPEFFLSVDDIKRTWGWSPNVVTYQSAILPAHSRLAEVLGVEDEQAFIWREQTYRVTPCAQAFSIQTKRDTGWSYVCTQDFQSILQHYDEIEFPIKPTFGQPEVADFIEQFRTADELFSSGMCYWFAHILHHRFPDSVIVYNPVDNHFACRISGAYYDANGVADGLYSVDWDEYKEADPAHAERIEKYCIRKEK